MLQHVEGKKDGDMRQFHHTQKELCLYNSTQKLAACRDGFESATNIKGHHDRNGDDHTDLCHRGGRSVDLELG
eukprot:967390-Amphidinium_carterae.1